MQNRRGILGSNSSKTECHRVSSSQHNSHSQAKATWFQPFRAMGVHSSEIRWLLSCSLAGFRSCSITSHFSKKKHILNCVCSLPYLTGNRDFSKLFLNRRIFSSLGNHSKSNILKRKKWSCSGCDENEALFTWIVFLFLSSLISRPRFRWTQFVSINWQQ